MGKRCSHLSKYAAQFNPENCHINKQKIFQNTAKLQEGEELLLSKLITAAWA
jgi:hypothetical protein